MSEIIAIAIGASLGAILRYLMAKASFFKEAHFYLSVLLINVLGSALFGFLHALINTRFLNKTHISALVFTGFLGSFTTFSTLTFDTHNLITEGRISTAGFNILAQVMISLVLFYLCLRLGQSLFK